MLGISYWFLPLFAGVVWLGTLAGMIGYWLGKGSPHYVSMAANQHIAYISDVGATDELKPLFIAGSATMVVIFDLAFISERWLRHERRLTPNYSKGEAFLSVCAIICAIIGAAGLIFLTIFDTKRYPHTHDALLVVFIAGYIISAIFICAEYQRLGIHYREYRVLRASFWLKLAFIFVEVGLAIGFGVCNYKSHYDIAAILEWVIALVYIFYVWSFILDFLPARGTRAQEKRFPLAHEKDEPNAFTTQDDVNVDGGPHYALGGPSGESSHGNSQPIADSARYYNQQAPPSTNF